MEEDIENEEFISTNSSRSESILEDVSSLVINVPVEKDKTLFAPIDIEVQILNERIKAILEQIISKTELIIFLNTTREFDIRPLLEEGVSKEDLEVICDEEFFLTNNDYVQDTYKIITRQMIEDAKENPECLTHEKLTNLFDVLAKNPQIKPIIKARVQEKMLDPPDTSTFLRAMYRLKAKIEDRITMSALDKLRRDVMQNNLKRTNQMFKEKITDLNEKLSKENGAFDVMFQEKDAVKKSHQGELDLLKSECVTIIKKKIIASEHQMMRDTTQHKVDFENLVEQNEHMKVEYDDLVKLHIAEEDQLRAKRFKIETTLLSWLQKYDKEIGDKQKELDNMTDIYEKEKIALADLHKRFDEQEERYIPLITMKRNEEEMRFAMTFNAFRTNYAATKIQRWWRAYLKKYKRKKGKKKKK